MCTTGATVVMEVTNPQNPQVIGRINGPNSTWRDVKTYQNRAYTVSEGGSASRSSTSARWTTASSAWSGR